MSVCRLCFESSVLCVDGIDTCVACGCVAGPAYVNESCTSRCSLAERQEEDEENWYDEYPDSDDCFVNKAEDEKNDHLE